MKKEMSEVDVYNQVKKNINNLVDNKVSWSIPVSEDEIIKIKSGVLDFNRTKYIDMPREWFPESMGGLKVLCLAGAGGQQAPVFAAVNADVTVIDLSENMLKQDIFAAERYNLSIRIEEGNICDLSRFSDGIFDLIYNPPSLFYVPDVSVVFKECYRVLKKGGVFIMEAPNPMNYICDYIDEGNSGYYKVCNKLPYRSFEFEEQGDWVEYGHSLEDLIGGQTRCGFAIVGFTEKNNSGEFCDSSFCTKSVKL